jgi:hypothetical protein
MSTRLAPKWPSPGFGILVASYALLVGFLAWGFATPELDRVWRTVQRMREPGFTLLRPSELQTLSDALRRHPTLALALAQRSPVGFIEPSPDGCTSAPVSHLLVQPAPGSPLRIEASARGASARFPLTVALRGEGIARTLRFDAPAHTDLVLPPDEPPVPTLVTVTVTAARAPTAPSSPVRLCIEGQALPPGKAAP